ncbi:hypothetical protein F4556_005011 [Kitasatospora gansuensis]|uniref:Phage head morphogenesis domain-containing protein n=1 Tax=Kitasatospora gansuensis TaxID=258050 RepID=A0A7W7SFF0_9ACTN|nr:hypothetical protein [Kitasatospora gansuensis]MBB4949476.1 hypothetical protein [Kitasatospora gansuensis]
MTDSPRADAEQAADDLGTAWQPLAAAQAAVLTALAAGRRTARLASALAEFTEAIRTFHHTVDAVIGDFAHREVARRYEEAARAATAGIGRTFEWTPTHQDTLRALTADTYSDLLRRAQETVRTSGAFYRAARAAARHDLPLLAVGRATAPTGARALADRLASTYQLDRVVYRNGTRMPVQAWAEAALHTRAAVATNTGTLAVAREHGISHVEVSDGYDCGWTSHPDPDKATRTLRSVEEAAEWPISHPRCNRGFRLQPDISPEA